MTRQQLRQSLLNQRRLISTQEQERTSSQIAIVLAQHHLFQSSQTVAIYSAIDGEINPLPLLKSNPDKQYYLPVMQKNKLLFTHYSLGDRLYKNRFSIFEPELIRPISPKDLDLVLVPVVGFSIQGNRLGRGAGFYDRTFSFLTTNKKQNPYLVGIAYEWQKVNLTAENWDVPMSLVITEQKIYNFLS
jgi:5-formyltetrahydrofolate cyclo-ligase